MSTPDSDTIQKMHRWFAVEYNNRAWDLAEQESREAGEDEEMLRAAHASALHWSEVGTALNDAKSNALLAEVYAQLGHGALALEHANASFEYFETHEGTPWDRAFAVLELACAHGVLGNCDAAAELLDEASQLGAALEDQEERGHFRTYQERVTSRIATMCEIPD